MAKVARRHNVRLYRPRFVYSAAETLRDFMREEIEEQFNAKVFDFYGSREVGAVAGECRYGRRYVFIMNNVVEILPDRHGSATSPEVADHPAQSPARRGDEAPPEGRILVTNLHTRAFPLIRYEIGDTGAMGAEPGGCPCGSPLPTLAKLTGRVSDHFVRRDGALVHGEYFTHLFYFRPWVESFRVDQLAHGHIRARVAPSGQVDEDDVAEIIQDPGGDGRRVQRRVALCRSDRDIAARQAPVHVLRPTRLGGQVFEPGCGREIESAKRSVRPARLASGADELAVEALVTDPDTRAPSVNQPGHTRPAR